MAFKVGDLVRISGGTCTCEGRICRITDVEEDGCVRYETADDENRPNSCYASLEEQASDHILTLVSKEGDIMSDLTINGGGEYILQEIKALTLSAEEKVLRDNSIIDELGRVTEDGKTLLWHYVLKANKSALVADLKKLEASTVVEAKKAKK